jgi:hypothetical protein
MLSRSDRANERLRKLQRPPIDVALGGILLASPRADSHLSSVLIVVCGAAQGATTSARTVEGWPPETKRAESSSPEEQIVSLIAWLSLLSCTVEVQMVQMVK